MLRTRPPLWSRRGTEKSPLPAKCGSENNTLFWIFECKGAAFGALFVFHTTIYSGAAILTLRANAAFQTGFTRDGRHCCWLRAERACRGHSAGKLRWHAASEKQRQS